MLLFDLGVGGTACLVMLVAILTKKKTKHIPTVDSREEDESVNPESPSTQRDAAHKVVKSEIQDPLTFHNEAYMPCSSHPVGSGGETMLGVCVVSMETQDAVSDETRGAVLDVENQETDNEGYEIVNPPNLVTPTD